jgi:hypothetical protein
VIEPRRRVISSPCDGHSPGRSLPLGLRPATPAWWMALAAGQSVAGSSASRIPRRGPPALRNDAARGIPTCRRRSDSARHRRFVDDGTQCDVPAESHSHRSNLNLGRGDNTPDEGRSQHHRSSSVERRLVLTRRLAAPFARGLDRPECVVQSAAHVVSSSYHVATVQGQRGARRRNRSSLP